MQKTERQIDTLISTISLFSKRLEKDEDKMFFAKSFTSRLLLSFLDQLGLKPRSTNFSDLGSQFNNEEEIISAFCRLLQKTSFEQVAFYIGEVYTSLLPARKRSSLGAFYTHPIIVNRMLTTLSCKADLNTSKFLDPSCGIGIFLIGIVKRLFTSLRESHTNQEIIELINDNVQGYEIDRFAAELAQILLESFVRLETKSKTLQLKQIITIRDSLNPENFPDTKFDIILGNPPFGRIKLDEKYRLTYGRSLYGHANLYGLFVDLALRMVKKAGAISFVLPTSFLGGQYFKNLRQVILQESSLINIDFIKKRTGTFSDVLQETALITLNEGRSPKPFSIHEIECNKSTLSVKHISDFSIPNSNGGSWLIPRESKHISMLKTALKKPFTLKDYGYEVKTGQLVWNRHKKQLRSASGSKETFPLIWSESILPNGSFHFQAKRKNHEPFIELEENQNFLVTNEEVILIQRTTSKEQNKRLLAALLPKSFLRTHKNGVVIENHVNLIKKSRDSLLSLKTLCLLLNSESVDLLFRCISGSVAVSAYELNRIPLPDPKEIECLEALVSSGHVSKLKIKSMINRIYGRIEADSLRTQL